MSKSNQQVGGGRINNMVPPNATEILESVAAVGSTEILQNIANGDHFSRILLDIFGVSVSPIVSKKGWCLKPDPKTGKPLKRSVGCYKVEDVKLFENGKSQQWTRWASMSVLLPPDFIEWFFNTFAFLHVAKDSEKDIGGGNGYTGGMSYDLFSDAETDPEQTRRHGRIQFLYCDPSVETDAEDYTARSAYTNNHAMVNYARQRVNIKIGGDGLQAMRERGVMVRFLLNLWKYFRDPKVTMADMTCDLFNYGFQPIYFQELYKAHKYTGRSKLNVMGDCENPTVYIGEYKADRTLMLYDKLAESKTHSQADEPSLVKAVEAKDTNTFFRAELHITGKELHASQVFEVLVANMWDSDPDALNPETKASFWSQFSTLLHSFISKKCRFLVAPRDEKNCHTSRIATDRQWQAILEVIKTTETDFAFKRPTLTLEQRKHNFLIHSLGGMNLMGDILKYEGMDSLQDFLDQIKARAKKVAVLPSPEERAERRRQELQENIRRIRHERRKKKQTPAADKN